MQDLIITPKILGLSIYEYTDSRIEALLRGLSLERLNRYVKLAPHNKTKQLQLYVWNTALSESLYTPIQGLEIIARNYFNNALTEHYGEEWYSNHKIQFTHPQIQSITQVKENLKKKKTPLTLNNLVSMLSFSFWIGLLGPKYETSL